MKFLNWILITLSLAILVSCASGGRQSQEKLRKLVGSGKISEAEAFVKEDSFFPEKENKLLKLIEVGTTAFLAHNYYQALTTFNEAQELSDMLFTQSISKKVMAAVSNDNADNYYGEKYERSLIRFYQSLCHYSLYMAGTYEAYDAIERDEKGKITAKKTIPLKVLTESEKKFHLGASKNVLLEWDSMLSSLRATSGGEVTYKDDLLAKIYGAFIHEQMGTSTDLQIAKDLYKAAKELLFKNYNIYQTYNGKYLDFRKNFSSFEKLDLKAVENNFTAPTVHYKDLVSFIDKRLEKLKKNTKDNLFVMIESGMIAEKTAKKFDFPLPLASLAAPPAAGAFASQGTKDFVTFVQVVLAAAAASLPKIYFELPELVNAPIAEDQKKELILKDATGRVFTETLVVVNPLSDIANQALDEKSISLIAKTGARVAAKHVAALGTAYIAYLSSAGKGIPEGFALIAASGMYAAANKGIEMSERADLRSWAILPHHYRMASLQLPKGQYKVFEKSYGKEILLGEIDISNEQVTKMASFRDN